MTQALKDILESLDSSLAKHTDQLEQYKEMLEEMEDMKLIELDISLSYELVKDYIDKLESIRGDINE